MKLYNGDCLEIMDKMIKNGEHVDCVFTSPPYNMNLRILDGKYVSRCNNKNYVNEFTTKYNSYKDDLSMEEYFNFQDEFIEKALQLSDLVIYNIQLITGNKVAVFKLFGKYAEKIKEVIIWNKVVAQPAMHEGILNSQYEFIIVFQNSKPFNRMFDICGFQRGTETNVWNIPTEKNTLIKAGFPKALVERVFRNFTQENDVILDSFMGSGTCGIVCQEMNREFIGIELDKEMFETAKGRLENNSLKRKLF